MKKWSVLIIAVLTVLCLSVCHAEGTFDPAAVAVGDIVTFGHYEQDNDLDNGPELIEWIVLDVQDGKALLLSKYGLDAKPYNKDLVNPGCVWETCTLRSWLNNEFLDDAFSEQEQQAILLTDVDNSEAQGFSKWGTTGGKNTKDKIFLLSYAEANRYLGIQLWEEEGADQNLKSRAAPTAYAVARGAWANKDYLTADGEATGWFWFLRSPGCDGQEYTAIVNFDGSLGYVDVYYEYGVDRPAFWLNMESEIF